MTQQNIQMFLTTNQGKFEPAAIPMITQRLQMMDDNMFSVVAAQDYKDPTIILIVSILIGGMGIDRFLLGDIGMGVLKLLTFGCFGILTIIDWFTVSKKAREKNFQTFMAATNTVPGYQPQYQPPYQQPPQNWQPPQQ